MECAGRAGSGGRSVPTGWLLLAASLTVGAALVPVCGGPARGDEPQQVIRSVIGDDRIQREPPLPERTRQSIGQVESQPEIQNEPPAGRPPPPPPNRSWNIDLAWLPYAILGVIGIGLLVILSRYLGFRRGLNQADRDKPAAPPAAVSRAVDAEAPERDRSFDEIDALAQSGAFTEAVHRLLLLVQARLRNRIEQGFQVSLTSREMLRRARLPGEAATAFATLVAAVEISHFGMRAANRATYALCREHCRRVLAAAE